MPPAAPDLDQLARGFVDPAQDRALKQGYLRWFPGARRLLDVGCGAGAFLAVAQAAGVAAHGLDAAASAVAACRAAGLSASHGDAAAALAELAQRGERYDGALLAHVVEHLDPPAAAALLAAIAAVLAPGARLVVVTPNLRNQIVLEETFWLDPTHRRPYPPALLVRLGESAGLQAVWSGGDPASRPRRPPLRRWLAWLRSRLSGADRSAPMDAVVVFERRGKG